MKNSAGYLLLLVGLVLLFLFLWRFLKKFRPSQAKIDPQTAEQSIVDTLPGTGYNLLSRYVKAQSKVETNAYRDHKVSDNFNLYGMKLPGSRFTLAIGSDKNGYAIFRSLEDSTRDLTEWFKYTKFPKFVISAADYVSELKKRNYFEADEEQYLTRLKKFL